MKDIVETINLKSAVVVRVQIGDDKRVCAFSTKTIRGERGGRGNTPEPKEHVPFKVTDICIDSTDPWYRLEHPILLEVIWSNVLSVQHENANLGT